MDAVWRESDTTPSRIEAALRDLEVRRHGEEEDHPFVPARVMNLSLIHI